MPSDDFALGHSQSRLAVRFTAKNGRYPGEWTNLEELNFHYENRSPMNKMHLNPCQYAKGSTELRFIHFSGLGSWFFEGHPSDLPKME